MSFKLINLNLLKIVVIIFEKSISFNEKIQSI